MRKIELSEQAIKRLEEITEYYLKNESTRRAEKMIQSFDDAFNEIIHKFNTCKKYLSSDFVNLDIRIYSHFKTYHIYFIVYPDKIRIAEIFHLKQAGDKLLLDL